VSHPVYVEAESRRIGVLQLPDAVIAAIRAAPCLRVDARRPARADFLLRDYDYFVARPTWLIEQLGHLRRLQSNETLARWTALVEAGEFRALVEELLEQHYDPLYQRSQEKNYRHYESGGDAATFVADDLGPAAIDAIAAQILAG
ncbi:MAG: tRNA 2-selenouridine(34) synthase MnmH, partial [Rhodocyclaceae bacterium]|nr:tRNA 2-selenouridine(34) synthase MnmH [Rhodocyclaceae bacterium]